jgi:hypothetical protein
MRHKEQASQDQNLGVGEFLRLQRYAISDPEQLPLSARLAFSAMKYGDAVAIVAIAQDIAQLLQANPTIAALVASKKQLWLASSAYGAVPSAASTLTEAVTEALRVAGWEVHNFKIDREGGFQRTNYGALGHTAREKAIRHRKISIPTDVALQLRDQVVVVLDDLRCTGAHERAVAALLSTEAQAAQLAFVYCITFEGEMKAEQEEKLNHAKIKHLSDLLPMYRSHHFGPILNARLLKFILRHPVMGLQDFWPRISREGCLALYEAAMSSDGYYDMPRFQMGFASLEAWLYPDGHGERVSHRYRCTTEGKIVAYHLRQHADGRFQCAETGRDMHAQVSMYSRFKFGDVPALHAMVQMLTATIISDLESGGKLSKVFERARDNGDFISLTAPGVRNVISASNQLAREVGLRVNAWLTLQRLPTMIIRNLGRLSSGRANYATLSAKQRATEAKTTQTIIPRSEYQDFPSHVIFLDDVEVTGTTCNRARQKSMKAGALSFHAIFAFKIDPAQASTDASIEQRMNQCAVTGKLDAGLAEVLQHVDYEPVQRMLRLLLQPDNRATLQGFLKAHVSDRILQRIFLGAMANDYLWIHATAPGEKGEYGPSLEIMAHEMRVRGLLDASGRILNSY